MLIAGILPSVLDAAEFLLRWSWFSERKGDSNEGEVGETLVSGIICSGSLSIGSISLFELMDGLWLCVLWPILGLLDTAGE